MTIGLLLCDHPDPDVAGIAGGYDAMFRRWLEGDWRVYDLTAGDAPNASDCDAWVSTGSRLSVYDDVDWVRRFAQLVGEIDASGRPFLGVCFGHQMIAHALGGQVAKSPRGWGVGVHPFVVGRTEAWMQPPLETVSFIMSCQDQVQRLPQGSVVLASTEHCPVGMFRLRNLLGIQGHPEWGPAYAAALLTKRRDRIGAALADSALATLTTPCNSAETAAWARAFFHSCAARPL